MIKRLDLILNGKGGVGKSFFAVNFVQYLKDKNILHVACDCDNENSTLKRFHGEAVEFLDLCPSTRVGRHVPGIRENRSRGGGLPRGVHRSVF